MATATELLPARRNLTSLRRAAVGCRACPLWRDATQTVFGNGPRSAELMLVGEQPGDAEDRRGRPFVGPAGKLLDRLLEQAEIDPRSTYRTNVVKHFKWKPRGRRRIHQTPRAGEIEACRPWLEQELEVISPRALLCLGATAAKALLGSGFRVTQHRGEVFPTEFAELTAATVHPSSLLRIPDEDERRAAREQFIVDVGALAEAMRS